MMYDLSKLVALILSFCLGFGSCGGVMVGGTAIALTSFKVRDLEKKGYVDIPDELFIGENPQVDLLNLSAFQFVDELKEVYGMGDSLTIEVLENRYAIKIPSAADKFLTDDAKKMPVKKLFSEAGVKELLATVYIGYVQSFECHAMDSTDPADPSLGEGNARWYNPTTGKYVTGINETLAFISLGDFVSGKVDVTAVIGGLHIGEALGYYPVIDEGTGKEVWCDGTTGEPVTGIMGVFAGCTVHEVGTKVNTVEIGELLGYVKNSDGVWCEKNEANELVPVTGFMKVLADSSIDTIGEKIEGAKLGDILGYYYDDTDARWEEDSTSDKPVTGLMKILADSKMDEVGEKIEGALLGDLFGYYYDETDARWEEDDSSNTPVSGFMKILAGCTIKNVGEKIEGSKLGDFLGYYYDKTDARWEEDDSSNTPVNGFMKILADSKMDEVGDKINGSKLGDLFGYHKKPGEPGWFQYDDYGNEVAVDGFNNKIADEKLDSIGDAFNKLTVADIVSEENRESGIFAIIDPTTPITKIGDEINESITHSPLQFFMNEGLITFETEGPGLDTDDYLDLMSTDDYMKFHKNSADFAKYYKGKGDWTPEGDYYLVPKWRTQSLGNSFNYIISLITKSSIPISD